MASSWLTSWLSSWGDSWGATPTPTPAQTGGAGYFLESGGEVRRKKRRDTLREDIARAQEEVSRVTKEIETEHSAIEEAVERVELTATITVTPRLDHLYAQRLEAELKLQQLKTLLHRLEIQRDEDDVEILLLSIQ
jgi:hypothetical protein